MDTELIKGIISLVVASIPLIILIFSFFINRDQIATEANDSFLRIFTIKRVPYNEGDWKKVQRWFNIQYFTSLFIHIVLFAIIYLFYISKLNIIFQLLFFCLIALNIIFIFITISNSFKNYFEAPKGRYYLFRDIDCIIEAERKYLFNKCQEAFKSLKFQLIEIDEDEGEIEACKIYFVRGAVTITISLEKLEKPNSLYKIKINCWTNTRLVIDYKTFECRNINLFIDRLISKPKSEGEKIKSEIAVSSEGED